MRYLQFLSLFALASFRSSVCDKDAILGNWSFYELKDPAGKVNYAKDPVQQKLLTDALVKEQLELYKDGGIDESMIRELIDKQFKAIDNITFTFKNDGKIDITSITPETPPSQSDYRLDQKAKTIVIRSEAGEMTYTYQFHDDKVTLSGPQEEFTFVRKKA